MSRSRELWTRKLVGGGMKKGRETSNRIGEDVGIWKGIGGGRFKGVVMGVDPSLRGTGLAVVEVEGDEMRLLGSRRIGIGSGVEFSGCLGMIYEGVEGLIREYGVEHVAFEQTVYVQNYQTVHILGSARGAAMAAAAVKGLVVREYAPLRVKQSVVGYGKASKEQVLGMVKSHLRYEGELTLDEGDAAAVALCHVFTWRE